MREGQSSSFEAGSISFRLNLFGKGNAPIVTAVSAMLVASTICMQSDHDQRSGQKVIMCSACMSLEQKFPEEAMPRTRSVSLSSVPVPCARTKH